MVDQPDLEQLPAPALAGLDGVLLPGETGDDFHSLDRLYPLIAPWTKDIPGRRLIS